jgi:hypothetical protein
MSGKGRMVYSAAKVARVQDVIDHPQDYGLRVCSFCGVNPIYMVAVFIPNEQFAKRIGQPPGKERLVVYALCENCFAMPDKEKRAEDAILEQMGVH